MTETKKYTGREREWETEVHPERERERKREGGRDKEESSREKRQLIESSNQLKLLSYTEIFSTQKKKWFFKLFEGSSQQKA